MFPFVRYDVHRSVHRKAVGECSSIRRTANSRKAFGRNARIEQLRYPVFITFMANVNSSRRREGCAGRRSKICIGTRENNSNNTGRYLPLKERKPQNTG